ncbi:MAG: hypothetical protein JZD41_07425 [Thermoproteus sp.]|nr:hypothetical protein [Thermoproteus sp.]
MKGSSELKRTVIVEGALSKRKIEMLRELEERYEEILRRVVEFGLKHKITSFARLKGEVYREIREKYRDLPSHYIYTACQDAAARLKSFKKMRRKGRAKGERPEIRRVSIWLDDHIYRQIDDFAMRVSTHKGHMFIPLNPHKLYWIYKNTGWELASEAQTARR